MTGISNDGSDFFSFKKWLEKKCLPSCQEKNVSNWREMESNFLPVAMIPRLLPRVRRGFALRGEREE